MSRVLAVTVLQQGLIYDCFARAAAHDVEAGRGTVRLRFARFTESLAISRRIGDEASAANSLGELGRLLHGRRADAGGDRGLQMKQLRL